MKKVYCIEEQILIDTYPEAAREELPMFAENRVHQRFSGNPYPNKVVQEAQRSVREKREYTLLKLENEFLEIGILPELGGKIWYAKDKKKGYDFFYKNNVVKPALIGVLGSWTSGGLEFNWPFHHRASTFMPVDYAIEEKEGEVTVWMSEHEPMDRMKGMVGISLKEGECIFHTKMKVDNLTSIRRTFNWWENAAVPVHEDYELFFPEDVNYVRFHYKRSVTTFPIANNEKFGAYNGIIFDGDTDISRHGNTKYATSYFSADSEFDYFGGYDCRKGAGVVHIADHHISPGKKMFTWAYSQLAKTWENALTDEDGQYAELMAACYSDNQPDVSWLAPYETKRFTQSWFPIHDLGKPVVANENGALFLQEGKLYFQSVRPEKGVEIYLSMGDKEQKVSLASLDSYEATLLVEKAEQVTNIRIVVGYRTLLCYSFGRTWEREIPEPRKEYPDFKSLQTPQELYIEGLHMEQFRSPEYSGETCFLEALKMDAEYTPALIELAEIYYKKGWFTQALEMAERAEKVLLRFNTRPESGKCQYLKGLILLGLERFKEAYDSLYRSAWCEDSISAAMLHIGLLDMRNGDLDRAEVHFALSLEKSASSVIALAFRAYAQYMAGRKALAKDMLDKAVASDPLNLYAHAFQAILSGEYRTFCQLIKSDISQVLLDLGEYFLEAGCKEEYLSLLKGVQTFRALSAMPLYIQKVLTNGQEKVTVSEGIAFPSRAMEEKFLRKALVMDQADLKADYLLGCLLYASGRYAEGAKHFEGGAQAGDYRCCRNLAVAYYSHLNDKNAALEWMAKARKYAPSTEKQIAFESVYLMAKMGEEPTKIIGYLESLSCARDELTVELARAYNHNNQPERALAVLLQRDFVACEGGEHYIADQYMFAYYLIGKEKYEHRDYEGALSAFRAAQVLPQSLGSGLWNEAKLVPYQYFEAACLQKLGKEEEAKAIYQSFKRFYFDYFSDMYLITLAYYVARAYEELGEKEKGKALLEGRVQEFERARVLQDTGRFGTTPFFISFIDEPAEARKKNFAYPLYLFSKFLKDTEREKKYKQEYLTETYGTYIEDMTC